MTRKYFIVPTLALLSALGFSACAGTLQTHTYWLKNQQTGTYSTHRTYSRLSADEIRELGLETSLPEGAKVVE